MRSAAGLGLALVLVAGAGPGDDTVEATRGPYLQSGATSSVLVVFHTGRRCRGLVEFGRPPALDRRATGGTGTRHVVGLTGLEPATRYDYRVGCDGERASGPWSFTTYPDGPAPFTFAVLGDSGTGSEAQRAVARLIEGWAPALVLHVGDLIYGRNPLAWDARFFLIYRALLAGRPFYPVPGDNDVSIFMGWGALFDRAFHLPANNPERDERYYSFDVGDVHFVALDSTRLADTDRRAAMLAWLEDDLRAHGRRFTVVFMHHPPYSAGLHHGSDRLAREHLAPVFERHGVDLVLSGHDHHYERTHPVRGVVYVVTGGGGARLRGVAPQPFTAYAEPAHHAVRVDVGEDRLRLRAVRPDGRVMDEATVEP
jgi:3',5'-cyclic AMP phosphodiesterase CpdA